MGEGTVQPAPTEQPIALANILIKPCYHPDAAIPEGPACRLVILRGGKSVTPATATERAYIDKHYPQVGKMLRGTAGLVVQ